MLKNGIYRQIFATVAGKFLNINYIYSYTNSRIIKCQCYVIVLLRDLIIIGPNQKDL